MQLREESFKIFASPPVNMPRACAHFHKVRFPGLANARRQSYDDTMKTLRVALVQLSAGRKVEDNLRKVKELATPLSKIDLIALPEVFAVRGSNADYRSAAESLDGRIIREMSALACSKQAWVLAGSIIEKAGQRRFNTSVLIDRRGRIAGTYRKMHLFEARLDNGKRIREADTYDPGKTPLLVEIDGWRTGLSICYDLRFPELFRHYAAQGAHLILAPSNFTQRTGKDHWEILIRARAIENQCFVVAPDQCGINRVIGVPSYGHSAIVGPWGEVLADAGTAERILTLDLDPSLLTATRRRIPALRHRVLP